MEKKNDFHVTKREDFALAALTVAGFFLLFFAFLICWKAGWSWDSIKQGFVMLGFGFLAFLIFAICYMPSLGLKLTQKFAQKARILLYSLFFLLLFIFILWFVLDDLHRHHFGTMPTIFLVLITISGLFMLVAPTMGVVLSNNKLSRILFRIFIIAKWAIVVLLIAGFLGVCYWARYGN